MEDLAEKWRINERLHRVVLDQNPRVEKEYQQMMLASLKRLLRSPNCQ
jgi:hypothetical protein